MAIEKLELLDLIKSQLQKTPEWKDAVYSFSKDSNGDNVLTVSEDATPAPGEAIVVIRAKNDKLGLTASSDFTGAANLTAVQVRPSIIELAHEATALSLLEHLQAVMACSKVGAKVRVFQRNAGAVPTVADMIVTNLQAEIPANLFVPGMSL
jgi:hypothetical protein